MRHRQTGLAASRGDQGTQAFLPSRHLGAVALEGVMQGSHAAAAQVEVKEQVELAACGLVAPDCRRRFVRFLRRRPQEVASPRIGPARSVRVAKGSGRCRPGEVDSAAKSEGGEELSGPAAPSVDFGPVIARSSPSGPGAGMPAGGGGVGLRAGRGAAPCTAGVSGRGGSGRTAEIWGAGCGSSAAHDARIPAPRLSRAG